MMTEHDKALCDWAWALPPQKWSMIDENAAETPEGREELHKAMVAAYHWEEKMAGCF